MIAFFDSCHINVMNVVKNGRYIGVDENNEPLPKILWMDEKKQRYLTPIPITFCVCITRRRVL